jgi:hypothetical protein
MTEWTYMYWRLLFDQARLYNAKGRIKVPFSIAESFHRDIKFIRTVRIPGAICFASAQNYNIVMRVRCRDPKSTWVDSAEFGKPARVIDASLAVIR